MRNILVRILLRTTGPEGASRRRERGQAGERKCSPPFLSLLDWGCRSADAHYTTTFNALDLLREIFEVQRLLNGTLLGLYPLE